MRRQPPRRGAVASGLWRAEDFEPGVARCLALADEYEAKVYQANQPAARKYELIRVE